MNNKCTDSRASFLQALLDIIPVYIYWKGSDGKIQGCNQLQANALGFQNKDDLIGKTDYDLYDVEKANKIVENDQYTLREQTITKREEHAVNHKGQEFTVLSIKRPMVLEDGSLGLVGASIDISELKKTQAALLNAKAGAEAATEDYGSI